MPSEATFYRHHLAQQLRKRIARNPNYSVRAFATALAVSPGTLSEILNGKRMISAKVGERLVARLELSPGERERFVASILDEKVRRGVRKIDRKLRSRPKGASPSATRARELVDVEKFAVISEWYYAAILEMTYKPDFRADAKWIAKRLGIPSTDAARAFHTLRSLGLIEERAGRWTKTHAQLDTKDKTKTSVFHQRRVEQVHSKSVKSMRETPIGRRNHSFVTLCADPARIAEAKEKIQTFLWELSEFLEGGSPTAVYELALQLFPLERE